MKRSYKNFRILLMMFSLGLASVFMTNGSLDFDEVPINLPETMSESPIVALPVEAKNIKLSGGSGCGYLKDNNFQIKKNKKFDLDFKSDEIEK